MDHIAQFRVLNAHQLAFVSLLLITERFLHTKHCIIHRLKPFFDFNPNFG